MGISQVNPEAALDLLRGLAGPVAKRLSANDLTLEAGPPVAWERTELEGRIPPVETNAVRSYLTTLTPEGREGQPSCGFLFIAMEEGPSGLFWGYYWGFVGPTEDPYLAGLRRLATSKRLRAEIWEIESEVPARGMLRWFGIPSQAADRFVEIKAFGTLGAQLSGWAKDFVPAAVMMDLPNDTLLPGSQRSLPQLIGADLAHFLPFLRISLGLDPRTDHSDGVPYPVEMADRRRRPPLLFLSYSRKDDPDGTGSIGQLYREIQSREAGIAFLDSNNLKAGDEWRRLIDRKLSESAVLAVLVSSNSLESSEVEREFRDFVSKLMNEGWPGTVVPIPIDAASFEFFRTAEGEDDPWWKKSEPMVGGDPESVGLASFNFERDSLEVVGPAGIAERLLKIYGEHRSATQDRLSGKYP